MADNPDHQNDKRSGKDRRKLPRSISIYRWSFDSSGNWREERRFGGNRRLGSVNDNKPSVSFPTVDDLVTSHIAPLQLQPS
jgi:hypothetical protein